MPKLPKFRKMRGKNSQLYPFIELSYPFLVILSPDNPSDKRNDNEKSMNNKINTAPNVFGNENNNNRNYKKIDNNHNDNISGSDDNNNDNSNL